MFAVVEICGKQYKVQKDEQIDVDLINSEPGEKLSFNTVLLVAESDNKAKLGQPYLSGASVDVKVVEHFKGEKLRVFKIKPKKRHQKTRGHRQKYTRLEITNIKG